MLIKTQEGGSGKAQSGVRSACVEPRLQIVKYVEERILLK
jgi:hypothetical protein